MNCARTQAYLEFRNDASAGITPFGILSRTALSSFSVGEISRSPDPRQAEKAAGLKKSLSIVKLLPDFTSVKLQ